jgi:hypothetical protein
MQPDTITYFLCGTGVENISGKYKFNIEAVIGKDYYSLRAEHKQNRKFTANSIHYRRFSSIVVLVDLDLI